MSDTDTPDDLDTPEASGAPESHVDSADAPPAPIPHRAPPVADPGAESSAGALARRVALVVLLVALVAVPAYYQHQRFAARDARSAPLVARSESVLDEFRVLAADPDYRREFERQLLPALVRKANSMGANPVTAADTHTAVDDFFASLQDDAERERIARRLLAALRRRQQTADHTRAEAGATTRVSFREALVELGARAERDR